jgi:hypothetical protein
MLSAVLTTIQSPTSSVIRLCSALQTCGGSLVVIGDKKGPHSYDVPQLSEHGRIFFLSFEQQLKLDFRIVRLLQAGSYARKNIGYLIALYNGATCIYETDDDNAPTANWSPRSESSGPTRVVNSKAAGWVNVYRYFSDVHIWPRGFPLDEIRRPPPATDVEQNHWSRAPIQQGLVNGAADVDAIWRLTLDEPIAFEAAQSVYLPPGNWCPFNTQSTWWWPAAYPLLYIPSHCSFRMCDIWKSFVAQRCLWELSVGIVFHPPEVYQERNQHDLMADFCDEIPGYENNKRIAGVLESLSLRPGPENVGANLYFCYEALVTDGVIPKAEMSLVSAWLEDVSDCKNKIATLPEADMSGI